MKKLSFKIGFWAKTSITLFLLVAMVRITAVSQNHATEILPEISKTVVAKRMAELDKATPIQLDYNTSVQAYIDVYTIKRRDHLSNIIGRSKFYFPLFEEALNKHNLPLELKYLAIVESALEPRAKSTSGALGLWQFLYNSSQMFNLNITSYVDERCDPLKSTEAACEYLSYLYRTFNDWQLALAAYNVGPGEVKKAILRSGGKRDFWQIKQHLPIAAQSYVPAFIAVNYVMNAHSLYNIKANKFPFEYSDIDSVHVSKSLTFDQISKITSLSVDEIALINPMYTQNYLPYTSNPLVLNLPTHTIAKFINEVESLSAATRASTLKTSHAKEYSKLTHTVQKGEYFHKIAMMYHCSVDDILGWNKLKSQNLNAGQLLTIYVEDKTEKYFFIHNEMTNIEPRKSNNISSSEKFSPALID